MLLFNGLGGWLLTRIILMRDDLQGLEVGLEGGGTVELRQSAKSVSALNVFAIEASTPSEFSPG